MAQQLTFKGKPRERLPFANFYEELSFLHEYSVADGNPASSRDSEPGIFTNISIGLRTIGKRINPLSLGHDSAVIMSFPCIYSSTIPEIVKQAESAFFVILAKYIQPGNVEQAIIAMDLLTKSPQVIDSGLLVTFDIEASLYINKELQKENLHFVDSTYLKNEDRLTEHLKSVNNRCTQLFTEFRKDKNEIALLLQESGKQLQDLLRETADTLGLSKEDLV